MNTSIRFAKKTDVPVILAFIRELAIYEKLEHEVVANVATLETSLFGPKSAAEVLLFQENEKSVGIAIFFHNFSTFLGKSGIYLEDLFVKPECRGKGYGKQLLAYLAKLTVERECGRLEWSVLDWNKPALDFYASIGAKPMDEWTVQRLAGTALVNLAKSSL
jgi:GNAT superfamily N-acetyltransferase